MSVAEHIMRLVTHVICDQTRVFRGANHPPRPVSNSSNSPNKTMDIMRYFR